MSPRPIQSQALRPKLLLGRQGFPLRPNTTIAFISRDFCNIWQDSRIRTLVALNFGRLRFWRNFTRRQVK